MDGNPVGGFCIGWKSHRQALHWMEILPLKMAFRGLIRLETRKKANGAVRLFKGLSKLLKRP